MVIHPEKRELISKYVDGVVSGLDNELARPLRIS
jgi:hypothetical protein